MAELHKDRARKYETIGVVTTTSWGRFDRGPRHVVRIGNDWKLLLERDEAIQLIGALAINVLTPRSVPNMYGIPDEKPSDALRRLADILDHGSP